MKGFILSALVVGSFISTRASADVAGANQFLQSLGNQIEHALATKGGTAEKIPSLCSIFRTNAASEVAASVWLGGYMNTPGDQAGVDAFVDLVPSVILTIAMPQLSGVSGGAIDVSTNVQQRMNGDFATAITIHKANGSTLDGAAVVRKIGASYKLVDIEYLGLSGVHFYSRNIQSKLRSAASRNPSHPVSQLVQDEISSSDFVRCP